MLAADSKGTDFWLAFPDNLAESGGHSLSLFISSEFDGAAIVLAPGFDEPQVINYVANVVTEVDIPFEAELFGTHSIEEKAVRVLSDHEISVYAMNRSLFSTDGYLGLPSEMLGTEYMVLNAWNTFFLHPESGQPLDLKSEIAIVATDNGTTVTITPGELAGFEDPFTVSLNAGQTFQLQLPGFYYDPDFILADLAGMIIESNKPIAVFGGNQLALVLNLWGEHIVEQLPPVSSWGTNFVAMDLGARNFDLFRVLASHDDTEIYVNGDLRGTRDRGETLNFTSEEPLHITANHPVLVAQLSTGATTDIGGAYGDASMMLIPATDQYLSDYTVFAPNLIHPDNNNRRNFINIVAPTSAIDEITIDGVLLEEWEEIGSSGLSGAKVEVARGSHHLEGPVPFGATVYGFNLYEAYSYPAGMVVPNQLPSADAGSLYRVFEGGSLTLDGSASSDPDGDLLTYAWDVNGDNVFLDAAGATPTLSWAQLQALGIDDGPQLFDVRVRVNDGHGGSATSTAVRLLLSNSPPTATLANNGPVDEGGSGEVTFSGQFDPSAADTAAGFTYSYDFNSDHVFEITGSLAASAAVPAGLLDDGPGSVIVRGRISDKDGGFTEYVTTLEIINVAPTATLSNSGPVDEGSPATVAFSAQFDPSALDTAAGFTYSYDFDNDGNFEVADSVEASATVPAILLDDGPGIRIVRGRIMDKDGGYSDYLTTIDVKNVAPTASIAGPVGGVRGQPRNFTVSATDPSAIDQAAGFVYRIDWGDGAPVQIVAASPANGSGTSIDHVFTDVGSYTVLVTAEDKDGGVSVAAMHTISIQVMALEPDACDPTKLQLVAGGTSDCDLILVTPGFGPNRLVVTIVSHTAEGIDVTIGIFKPTTSGWEYSVEICDVSLDVFATPLAGPVGRIIVFGQAGDDHIQVSGSIANSAWLYGGAGDDHMKGGAGDDVLLGAEGDDMLVGGDGRDLLIGGLGRDRLVGNSDDDILIAGATDHDANEAALCRIMEEWTRSNADFATRVSHLKGPDGGGSAGGANEAFYLNDETVEDDGCQDFLTGSSGNDWFLFNQDGDGAPATRDKATDMKTFEALFAQDIDFINATC